MPCYSPLHGWSAKRKNPSGKYSITFNRSEGYVDKPISVPCGRCIGCRLERSRQWAMRCEDEIQLHENNCFITLTYDDENLPLDGTLVMEHLQTFMKNLRYQTGDKNAKFHNSFNLDSETGKIRFFACGEYGENRSRPHYHAILFGVSLKDLKEYKIVNKNQYYTSDSLREIWGKGFVVVGAANFETAAYVARYVTKKQTGENALYAYTEFDIATGEIIKERKPEFVTMSRRPGIGREWYNKYKSDCYPRDEKISRGLVMAPPKYYANLLAKEDPAMSDQLKARRRAKAKTEQSKNNNSSIRLACAEFIKKAAIKLLKRGYENE